MHHQPQPSFTQYVLVICIVLFLWVGWFARKLWQANDDVKSLIERLERARRFRRRALAMACLVGFGVLALAWHWIVVVNGG